MDVLQIDKKAVSLIGDLSEGCTLSTGFNPFSPTIYDTAWLAMVSKEMDGGIRWRFPECFQFLLDHQIADGGWEAYASEVDGILNTMAALLALRLHADAPDYLGCPLPSDIETRITKATTFLQKKLQEWDGERSIHVSFEILVPSLPHLLQQEGLSFTPPGHQILTSLHREKLTNFDCRILYGTARNIMLHF